MSASNQTKLIVWTKAAGHCSFPDCRQELVLQPEPGNAVPVGEVAHIVAEQPDGPRGDSPLSPAQRNQPPNLMLLCPNHHTEIDKAPQTYTVDRLREFKRRHEHWVRSTLQRPKHLGQRLLETPRQCTELLHSTLLPVERVPLHVFSAPPKTCDRDALKKELTRPVPFLLHSKQLFSFETLTSPDNAFSSVINYRQAVRENARDWWRDPDKRRLYVYLLGQCLNKVTGPLGLMLDRQRQRYYFMPTTPGAERKIKYRPLNREVSEISVVWQPIQKSRGEPYGYWLHRAVSCQFILVSSQQWLLCLRPEFHVTVDGEKDYEASEVGAKVTHKKARLYNQNLLVEVNFWRDFLANGRPRIIYPFNEQKLVIGTTLVQAELISPGVPGDHIPFRNVAIPETLFTIGEVDELAEDEFDEEAESFEERCDGEA